jgi:hypothetical protein
MTRAFAAAVLSAFIATTPGLAAEDNAAAPAIELVPVRTVRYVPPPATRGAALPVLYASYGALQAFDGFTTLKGIQQGAVESNPHLAGTVGQPAAVWALKAATTGAAIGAAERLWRQNRRTQAIVVLVVANGVMASVAARNMSVLRRRQ